jgi:UDP-glucose:(heptosyl)LPS alpha-1,3-glucosyltransferase
LKRRELGLGRGDCAVLFLGTGYARKGLDLLLEAFPRVVAAWPEARLLIAGFDSARARFEARAAELGIGARTTFLGGTLTPEHLYAAADLYVLPTRYDPFANSTLEALACGLPVITSTANGGGELIDAGVQGACIDVARGAEVLAEECLRWRSPERRASAARAARARAEEHGEESKFRAAEELFERLAERARPGSFRPAEARS